MTKLEKVTHVALTAVCCLAGGLLIEQRFIQRTDPKVVAGRDSVGRTVSLPGADWHAAPVSILLQISSHCPYCEESMPFYRQLAAACNRQAGRAPLIVASADSVTVLEKYLAERQVPVDRVLHSRLESIGAGLTPSVFVVDSKGLVKRAFVGKLEPAGERELLSIVAPTASKSDE